MVTSGNVTSTDAYTDANTYLQDGSGTLELLVANAAIYIRLYLPGGAGITYQWAPEQYIGPSISARTFTDVGGIQFRSAVAGSPAQVTATLFTQEEVLSSQTAAFTSTVSAAGVITPPPPTSGTLNFDHNGVLIAAEGTLDMVDATAVGNPTASPITWVPTDTPGSKVAYVPVFKLGVQHNDASQVNEAVLDLDDQATFPALVWTVTDDAANNRVKVKPTISGVMTVLADSGVLGAPAATIDFSSIPATFMTLVIHWYARNNNAGNTIGNLLLRMNNDSGANYDNATNYVDQTSSWNGVANTTGQTAANVGETPGPVAGAANIGIGVITIPAYASALFGHPVVADYTVSSAGNAIHRGFSGSRWSTQAAINRLTLLPAAGSFLAGSRAVLYGL